MPNIPNNWKTDLFPFVGKQFDIALKKKMTDNKIISLFGETTTTSAYYDLRGGGEFGELPDYDGSLNEVSPKRGFNTVVAPKERMGVYYIHEKQYKNDMSGEIRKCGQQLAMSAYHTINNVVMRKIGNAFNPKEISGDGKSWAAKDHPNASKGTKEGGRLYEADPSAGTYSNSFDFDLTAENITKMRSAAYRFETPAGNGYEADYSILLVPPELEGAAARICGLYAKLTPMLDPDNESNAANPVYGLKYYVCGRGSEKKGLGFAKNQWALVAPDEFKEVSMIVYNTKPESGRLQVENPKIKGFYSYVDLDVNHGDSRPILFSQF